MVAAVPAVYASLTATAIVRVLLYSAPVCLSMLGGGVMSDDSKTSIFLVQCWVPSLTTVRTGTRDNDRKHNRMRYEYTDG